MPSPDAADAWARIEAVLRARVPALHAALAPPAAPARLGALADRVGRALPDGVRDLYAHHDGQRTPTPGLFFGLQFLSVQQVGDEWERWTRLLREDPALIRDIAVTAIPDGAVKPVYASESWLPFASDGAGNHLAIDLAPGPEGTPGQFINFGADESVRTVLASSPAAFLHWVADAAEAGTVVADSGAEGGLGLRVAGGSTLLDALPELFSA